jgi:NAD(P)-dependent dehydrogenase (short-subunit alcohol dehydrogenase family)
MEIVITGANRGIGLELARRYLERGATVHAAVRTPDPAGELALLAAKSERLRIGTCDVALDSSVASFAAALPSAIDLLINNAGVRTRRDELADLELEEAIEMYQVNALGPMRVTRALLPRLRGASGAKVVNITSGLGSISDNDSGGSYGYRMSKAALNMASRSMSCDLASRGIVVVALSPGWVRTDMGGPRAAISVSQSAAGLLDVIDRLTLQDTGSFLDFRGERLAW